MQPLVREGKSGYISNAHAAFFRCHALHFSNATRMLFVVLAIIIINTVLTATIVHITRTSCICLTKHLPHDAILDIPLMLSDADARLLRNLTSYLEQAYKIGALKIENNCLDDQFVFDIEPFVFEGEIYTVELAQEKSLKIIDSIEDYPHFYLTESLLYDQLWNCRFTELPWKKSERDSNSAQCFDVTDSLLINARIFLALSKYDELASVLEKVAVNYESKKNYGTNHLARKLAARDFIKLLENVAYAEKKMPTCSAVRISESLRRIKLDLEVSFLSYLEFQRFNFSFPSLSILGGYLPSAHHVDMVDILDTLNLIDKYKISIMKPSRELVTEEEVEFARQALLEVLSNPNLSRDGQLTIPGYCLQEKKSIQFLYYHILYQGSRIDRIIEKMETVSHLESPSE